MVEGAVTAFLRSNATDWLAAIGAGTTGDGNDGQLWKLASQTRPWQLLHTFGNANNCWDLILYQGNIYAAIENNNDDRGDVEVSTDGGVTFNLEHSIDHFSDYASAFGIFGTELFVGEKNTDGVEFPEIHGRTAGGTWSVRHSATRNAIIEWTSFVEFGGFLYAATHANGTDAFGPEIWRTSDGTTFNLVETFPDDLERIDRLVVFQSKIFACIENDATNNIEIWESSDGLVWSQNTVIVSVANCQPRGLATDGTRLFVGEFCTSGGSGTRVHTYDGSTWTVSVDFAADVPGFPINASRVTTLGYDSTSGKVYAGCGSSTGGSTGYVAIMSCPTEDLGTPTDPDEGGGGGGGG